MSSQSLKNNIKNLALVLLFVSFSSFLFAQEQVPNNQAANRGYIAASDLREVKKGTVIFEEKAPKQAPIESEQGLTALQKQARLYRAQGYEAQSTGNLDIALSFYQKAVQLDPGYAVVYNDLGVVYEDAGLTDRAEGNYLKAIKLDPGYLSAYSNLALLYENKRELDKAVFYWKKRVELSDSDDLWTARAKKRLNDLAQVVPSYKQALAEAETINLIRQVAQNKQAKQEVSFKQAAQYLASAKNLYNRGQYEQAMEEINKALAADPQDKQKLWLKEKIASILKERYDKAQAKERQESVRKMRASFDQGVKYYQQGNPEAAELEFNKIIELTAAHQKN